MKFSNRINNMKQSPIRKLYPYANKIEEKGINVIRLNIGQPDIPTPKEFIDAINHYTVNILEYAPSQGIKKALETTQLYLHNYGLDFNLNEILITSGASEGIIFTIMTICDPDDEIITISPYYSNYNSFCNMSNVNLVSVDTKIEDNFRIPKIEEFEKVINKKTKAILISSPGNPTGRVYEKEEIDIIVNLAKKHNLFIIADEVYREFNFTDRKFISFAEYKEIENHVILIDSISKKYSACGARIGSVSSKNNEFMSQILKLAQARLSVSTLDQVGAGAMDIVDDEFVYKNRRIYKERRNVLAKALSKIPHIKYSNPEGAFYTLVKFPVEDAEDFILWTLNNIVVENSTVLLTPAESFYSKEGMGKNEARISYCVSKDKIELAGKILEEAVKKYPKIIK